MSNEIKEIGSTVLSVGHIRNVLVKYQEDVYDYNRKLEDRRRGKILTVIDGVIADETQRKAVKDLVNEAWYSATSYIDGHAHYPQMRHVGEALGFDLHPLDKDMQPAMPNSEYNPYKSIK